MDVNAEGWVQGAVHRVSPNFDQRPDGVSVSLIVVHAISLPPGQFGSDDIELFFTNSLDPDRHPFFAEIRDVRVSAHFLIRRNGELIQFVACHERAWHAGESIWHGRERCNDFSIGIELEGCDEQPFEKSQYLQLGELIQSLCRVYPIRDVVGHSEISPLRKTDPGPLFDWSQMPSALRSDGVPSSDSLGG